MNTEQNTVDDLALTESKELQEAEDQLARDNIKQNIWGGIVLVSLVLACVGFLAGVVITAHQINYSTNIYSGVEDEALPSWYGKRP